jgi:hypothetical protein|tara:strand:+ start:92 stop:871 length:780 start_codon:yes stop_codon:yes gene_type:complete
MNKIKFIVLFLLVSNFSFGQNYISHTYLRVPRQNMSEFLTLHKEMSEISHGENRLYKGHFVYAHRHASNYSLVVVNTFDNPEDVGEDQSLARTNLRNHSNSLNEDDKKSFNERWSRWTNMYLEGHYDEIRVRVKDSGFQSEDFDPTNRSVVVVSWYNPKWSNLQEFRKIFEEQKFGIEKELGNSQLALSSTHYSGRSPNFFAAMWYPSWEAFAKNETELDRVQANSSDGGRLWEIGGAHWDEILVSVGMMLEGKFVIAN